MVEVLFKANSSLFRPPSTFYYQSNSRAETIHQPSSKAADSYVVKNNMKNNGKTMTAT